MNYCIINNCLEGNSEKSKNMFMSRHQTARQIHYIKVANETFENVTELK
jgi:hypothetical protein